MPPVQSWRMSYLRWPGVSDISAETFCDVRWKPWRTKCPHTHYAALATPRPSTLEFDVYVADFDWTASIGAPVAPCASVDREAEPVYSSPPRATLYA
jgi:hypothetical protein